MKSSQKIRFPEIKVKDVEKPPYIVDNSRLRQFNSKNIVFERVASDPSWKCYMHMYDEKVPGKIREEKPGFSRVDFALAYASWTVHDAFNGGFSRKKIKRYKTPSCTVGIDLTKAKHDVDDPHKMSVCIKRAARLFGASQTGICKLNRKWLYEDSDVSEKLQNSVVMAVDMDADGIATSPAVPAAAATGVGYSRMAFILAGMGEFIRNLGYEAVQCGNDTALSVPLAIDAGLGELGRNGLLVTPRYGPRVRLCKIFTNMPLGPDKPIEFGVKRFCRKCKLCAKNCKAKAISLADEPSFEVACSSNNEGALKWCVNAELCYEFWCENGIDCSTCISICPYNKISNGKGRIKPQEFWKIV